MADSMSGADATVILAVKASTLRECAEEVVLELPQLANQWTASASALAAALGGSLPQVGDDLSPGALKIRATTLEECAEPVSMDLPAVARKWIMAALTIRQNLGEVLVDDSSD